MIKRATSKKENISNKSDIGGKITFAYGITLISLVITIIIMIILAGVILSLTIGKNGIINRAKVAKEKELQEAVKEEISIMLADYVANRYTTEKTLIEYLNEQKDNGKIDGVRDNEDGTYTVEKNGYEIVIKGSNLEIIEIGTANTHIKISNIKITTDGTTIVEEKSVKVGTKLQINFVHSIEGGITTVTPSLPYITDGTEMSKEFVITGIVNGQNYTKTITISLEDKYKEQTIADMVKIGDFVNYSVGNWTQADIAKLGNSYAGPSYLNGASKSLTIGHFGVGSSKDLNGLLPNQYCSSVYTGGWRCLNINDDGSIDIIHAGAPECIYVGNTYKDTPNFLINVRDWTMYEDCSTDSVNTSFAVRGSARCVRVSEVREVRPICEDLINIGFSYVVPEVFSSGVMTAPSLQNGNYYTVLGVRPVITLKAEIKVKAKEGQTTHVTQETAWQLQF